MHSAPSVSYPVGRAAFVGWWLLGIAALAMVLQAGPLFGWWSSGRWVPWHWGLSGGAWLLLWCWAFLYWWRSPSGWLIWDPMLMEVEGRAEGQPHPASGWWWSVGEGLKAQALRHVEPMWVGNGWCLLRVHWTPPGSGYSWIWVQATAEPVRWLALRRALTRHAH